MLEKMILAGFGGQGIMFMGKLLCTIVMKQDRNVTFIPSYGPEMRGGTANCHVILSDGRIASPMVEVPSAIVVMNQPSYEKFKDFFGPAGGQFFINTSLIKVTDEFPGIDVYQIPATDIANDMGNVRMANMVMMGAINQVMKVATDEELAERTGDFSKGAKAKFLDANLAAIEAGRKYVIDNGLA